MTELYFGGMAGELEVRREGGGTRLRGRFPYGKPAVLSDGGRTGRPKKEVFAPRAFAYRVELPDEDMDGYEVLRKLRLARIDTPTLILTGLDGTDSKLKGFGAGADDYLTKPFNNQELVARIHAIVRRSKGHAQSIIRNGKIAVNLDAKTVEAGDHPVHLTGKEYQILEL